MKRKSNLLIILLLCIVLILVLYFFIKKLNYNKDNEIIVSNDNSTYLYENVSSSNFAQNQENETPKLHLYTQEQLDKRSVDNVTMHIKEGTLSNTGVTLVITDNNEASFLYGHDYVIEKKENGEWKRLKALNDTVILSLDAFTVGYDKTAVFNIDWTDRYGVLKSGEYRILKSFLSAEFTIK